MEDARARSLLDKGRQETVPGGDHPTPTHALRSSHLPCSALHVLLERDFSWRRIE